MYDKVQLLCHYVIFSKSSSEPGNANSPLREVHQDIRASEDLQTDYQNIRSSDHEFSIGYLVFWSPDVLHPDNLII